MGYSRKKTKQEWFRIWDFKGIEETASAISRGYLKKKKKSVIPRYDQEKVMWNFLGSWF